MARLKGSWLLGMKLQQNRTPRLRHGGPEGYGRVDPSGPLLSGWLLKRVFVSSKAFALAREMKKGVFVLYCAHLIVSLQ